MSKEYLVVLPLEDMMSLDPYPKDSPLPPHCTVMPWFALADRYDVDRLIYILARLLEKQSSETLELVSRGPES